MEIRDTLLVVNHDANRRAQFRALFEKKYNILEAWNGEQAWLLLEQNHRYIVSVLLETGISGMTGWELMQAVQEKELLPQIPVIMLISEPDEDSERRALEMGAADVVTGAYDPLVVYHRVENIVELNRYKWHLEKTVKEQTDILRHSNDVMVDALSSLIEYRSVESGQHILRIRRFTQILMTEIARSCPEYQLNEATIDIVASASALHDIGKIAIPDSVLNKEGELTEEEWEIMKSHTLTGSRILEELDGMGNEEYLRYAHNICHYHHERWDGNGYPEGIQGEEIPICAQVVGLADAYDALTNKRVYKDAFSHERASNMILRGECGVFSPKLLECFKQVSHSFAELSKTYSDGRSPHADAIRIPLPVPENDETMDTLQAFQMKYHTILHYIDATVVEVDVEEGIYHLVYNPYPELAGLEANSTFDEGIQMLANQFLPEEGRRETIAKFNEEIQKFFEEGLRKRAYTYRIYSPTLGEERDNEVVFLRLRGLDSEKRRMVMIWRRLERGRGTELPKEQELPEGIGLEGVCRYRIDRWLTMDGDNRDLAELLGYTTEEVKNQFQNRLIELMAPEERGTIYERLREQLQRGKDVELECRMIHKDGRPVWILNKNRLTTGKDGREYLWGKIVDVTKMHHRQGVLQEELERCRILLAQVDHVTFEWDILKDEMSHSEGWMSVFGYEPIRENFSRRVKDSHLHPEDIEGFTCCLQRMKAGSPYEEVKIRLAKTDGRYLWCRFRGTTQFDEQETPVKVIGVILNIDESERAAQALLEKAERDGLTGLLNKKTGQEQVEKTLKEREENDRYALLIIDLDNFKQVNDRHGHMFGDAVLSQAAQEIRKQFRMDDIAARIGGDEFMVLMKKVPDEERVKQRCEKLVQSFERMFEEQLPGSGLTCSIGIAMLPDHGVAYQELFGAADKALYRAKQKGKNQFVLYDLEDTVIPLKTSVSQRIDSNEEQEVAGKNLIHFIFQRLYESGNVEETVQKAIEVIGKRINVSRVYIFENDAENQYCSNTFEWYNDGIAPEIEHLQKVSYETDIPGYEAHFDERGIFYCPDIRDLPRQEYEILEPQGIKSMLQCAIRDNGVFRGYVGFDECINTRLWNQEQIDMLTFLAEMISVFLLKKRAQDENERKAQELHSILDYQNNWIYIIDLDTFELKYINRKTRKMAPDAEVGMKCYQALRNKEERCEECPLINLHKEKNKEQIIRNDHLGLTILAEATQITWEGKEAGLMTCWEVEP